MPASRAASTSSVWPITWSTASRSMASAGTSRPCICAAIARHRIKDQVHGAYDELLKDADVLQHTLYNTQLPPIGKERARLSALWRELGIEHSI